LEIVRQKYFRANARTLGGIIILFTIYQITQGHIKGLGIPIYIALNLLAISFWTAKEIIVLDLNKKRIGEGFKVFGTRRVTWTNFSEIEKIFVNSVNTVGQDIYSLPWAVTTRDKVYKAFIKTSDGTKLFLAFDNDRDVLLKKLNNYNRIIKTEIFDNTR
jgi:hypothetical protein